MNEAKIEELHELYDEKIYRVIELEKQISESSTSDQIIDWLHELHYLHYNCADISREIRKEFMREPEKKSFLKKLFRR